MEYFRKFLERMILVKKCNQVINRELQSGSKGQIIRQRYRQDVLNKQFRESLSCNIN